MIKPGYTYRATWNSDPVIVYVAHRGGTGLEVLHLAGRLQGQSHVIEDRPRHRWVEVCEGRHSNPEALLTQTDPEPPVRQGDVRKGRATGARYEVLGVHGDEVWTHQTGGTLPVQTSYTSWSVESFLESTVEMPVFFEEGHDYEYRNSLGIRLRVTVRRIGKMPMGKVYAVAERRNGMNQYDPVLLTQPDFENYEDVTK